LGSIFNPFHGPWQGEIGPNGLLETILENWGDGELEKRLDISPALLFIYGAVAGDKRYGFETCGRSVVKTAEGMRKPGSHEGSLKPKEVQK